MKKILCLLLVVCMTMSFMACGNKSTTPPVENVTVAPTAPTNKEITTEEPSVDNPEENVPDESVEVTTENIEPTEDNSPESAEFVEDVLSGLVTDMTFTYTVYSPNENADGFIEEVIEVNEVNPVSVLWELKQRNPVLENVEINHCSFDDGFLTIDFNQAFADVVCSMGTSGELMIVGSVVNTYLSALHTDSMYFTVEGEILESGHTVYDFVMSYFSLEN